jgi:general secretion pathway protein I
MTRERGFTMLEVLVAFVIAALALGALYEGAMGGLSATAVAGRTDEAVTRAQSHLAVLGHGMAIAPGDTQGDDGGGYRWRMSIRPGLTVPVANGDAVVQARGPRATVYDVSVWISWPGRYGDTREVRLDSARLALVSPAGP